MASNSDKTETLKNFYYNKTVNSGAFRGPRPLHRAIRKAGYTHISLADCQKFLSSQDTYTLYRPARKNFRRNKFHVEEVGELLEFDIMEMAEYAEENEGYKYVLVCQDVWSRFTFIIPLKSKSAESVGRALGYVFKSGYVPQNAYCDRDRAFLSGKVTALIQKYDINLYTTTSKVIPQWQR